MKSAFLAFLFLFIGIPLVFGDEMLVWADGPTVIVGDSADESYRVPIIIEPPEANFTYPSQDFLPYSTVEPLIIKFSPPETRLEDGVIWSEGIVVSDCVRFSPHTEDCVTQIRWQFGLKKDGTVVWREVRGD